MQQFGVGVIGCGAISGNHFHGISQAEGAVLRAVCDIDEEKMKKTAAEKQAAGYTDYRELLRRPDIDVIHVCVPHYLHAPVSIAALKAGKHVLCEKPMGMTLEEAEAMAQAASGSGKALSICFQNRFNGASRRMKEIIESGRLGAVVGGSAFVCWDRSGAYYTDSPWRGKWATEGGSVLINQAIHTLDLMRWLSGGFSLTACNMSAKRLADTIETEDTCDMLLTNERGGRFLFYCTNCAPANMPVQLQLLLEKGELHMDGERLTVIAPEGTSTESFQAGPMVGKNYWGAGHDMLIADFYSRLQKGLPPAITAQDALETTRIMAAAYSSACPARIRP